MVWNRDGSPPWPRDAARRHGAPAPPAAAGLRRPGAPEARDGAAANEVHATVAAGGLGRCGYVNHGHAVDNALAVPPVGGRRRPDT